MGNGIVVDDAAFHGFVCTALWSNFLANNQQDCRHGFWLIGRHRRSIGGRSRCDRATAKLSRTEP